MNIYDLIMQYNLLIDHLATVQTRHHNSAVFNHIIAQVNEPKNTNLNAFINRRKLKSR